MGICPTANTRGNRPCTQLVLYRLILVTCYLHKSKFNSTSLTGVEQYNNRRVQPFCFEAVPCAAVNTSWRGVRPSFIFWQWPLLFGSSMSYHDPYYTNNNGQHHYDSTDFNPYLTNSDERNTYQDTSRYYTLNADDDMGYPPRQQESDPHELRVEPVRRVSSGFEQGEFTPQPEKWVHFVSVKLLYRAILYTGHCVGSKITVMSIEGIYGWRFAFIHMLNRKEVLTIPQGGRGRCCGRFCCCILMTTVLLTVSILLTLALVSARFRVPSTAYTMKPVDSST